MTYTQYWIVQSVRRYLEKCGSTVRIPSHTRQKMTHCRRAIERIEQEQGREPANAEISAFTGMSEKEVGEIFYNFIIIQLTSDTIYDTIIGKGRKQSAKRKKAN